MIYAQKQPLRYEGEISSVYGLPLYEKVDVQQLIDDAYARGEHELTLPRGAYRIWPREGQKGHICFLGMENFTLNAYGVVFLYQDNHRDGIYGEGSSEISVNGLTSDYENLIFTQCKLVEIGPDRAYTVFEFDEGYGRFTQEDIDNEMVTEGAMHSAETDLWIDGMEKMVIWLKYVELLDGGKRFRYNKPLSTVDHLMQVGDYCCPMNVGNYPAPGINVKVHSCGAIHLTDFTVWSSPISGIAEAYGEGGSTYTNVQLVPGPKPYGADHRRLLSMSGDGFHLTSLRKGPSLTNIFLNGLTDDGMNVHGIYSGVDTVLSPTKLIISNHGKFDYRPGDTLRFYDKGVNRICTTTVKASREITDTYKPNPPLQVRLESANFRVFYHHEVELHDPVTVTRGDWVVNENAICAGFTVRDSKFYNLCSRGIGMKTSNAVVENCLFDACAIAGIRIMPEHGWMECDYTENVVIRNNIFRRCGARNGYNGNGFSINGHEAIEHRNILIENNLFEDNYNRDMHLSCGRNITVRGNTFGRLHPQNQNVGREYNPLIHIDRCYGVTLENNTYTDPQRPVLVGPEAEDIKTDVPATLGSWTTLFLQGQQGRGGWHWQYVPVGSNDYRDFPIYDYDKRGWYTEDEADGCIRRIWWDTYMLPTPTTDVVKTYVCPKDGTLVFGTVDPIKAADLLDDTQGIAVQVLKNDTPIWPEDGFATVRLFKPLPADFHKVEVKAGDCIRFRLNHGPDDVGNTASWAPFVFYLQ